MIRQAALGCLAAAALVMPAHAQVADRAIDAAQPVSALFEQIVVAAHQMCLEAAARGETFDVEACTVTVVEATVDGSRRADLQAYASDVESVQAILHRN